MDPDTSFVNICAETAYGNTAGHTAARCCMWQSSLSHCFIMMTDGSFVLGTILSKRKLYRFVVLISDEEETSIDGLKIFRSMITGI